VVKFDNVFVRPGPHGAQTHAVAILGPSAFLMEQWRIPGVFGLRCRGQPICSQDDLCHVRGQEEGRIAFPNNDW
jgi:hypothetical protein